MCITPRAAQTPSSSGCDVQHIYSIQNNKTHSEPCALGAAQLLVGERKHNSEVTDSFILHPNEVGAQWMSCVTLNDTEPQQLAFFFNCCDISVWLPLKRLLAHITVIDGLSDRQTERGRGRVCLFSISWNVSCSGSRCCTKDSRLFVSLCVASRRAENKEKHLQPSESSCGRDEERRPQGSTTHMHTLVLLPL